MLVIKRILLTLLVLCASDALSQHALHWYRLKSIVPLDAAEGKEALALIRNLTTDSLSAFTDKNNTFKLATTTAVDMDVLTSALNNEGFFIADVTHGGGIPISPGLRSTEGVQHAILLEKNAELFQTVAPEKIILHPAEYDVLSAAQKAIVDACSVFIVKSN